MTDLDLILSDFGDYKRICHLNNIIPKEMTYMYEHGDEIIKDLGFNSTYDYFNYLQKVENRNKKIKIIIE